MIFPAVRASEPANGTTEETRHHLGGLTLLANIVMHGLEHPSPPGHARPSIRRGDERLAPIGHQHINMRGILTFTLPATDQACSARRPRRPEGNINELRITFAASDYQWILNQHFWHESYNEAYSGAHRPT
jgi:hypothetical protein